jgi:polyisoprenoid-binding protein YceI
MHTLSILRTHRDREIPVAGVYLIDPAHTSVEFVARHLMITRVRGRFADVSGVITIDEVPERSHVEVEVNVASIATGIADRDVHLRGDDFLQVVEHPTMTFRSTRVDASESDSWLVTGDLTVRGIARPVRLQVEFDGAGSSPAGDQRISFSAAAEVDREQWGLTWNLPLESGGVLVGKQVRIELSVQAVAVQ